MALERLYTPGPTPIPERIRRVMSEPIIHHRTAEFTEIFRDVSAGLKPLFGTTQDVMTLAASGTGGLEAAVANCCQSGQTLVSVNAGKFGERWTDLGRAYRLDVAELTVPYGQVATPEQLADFLDAQPHTVQAVGLTHSETSTGALHDIKELASVARDRGALVMVDAITSLGVHPIQMDEWGLDAVISGSQKGLMLPPGLAFVSLSEKARAAMIHADLPRFYFDLAEAAKQLAKGTTPFTPAISLIIGLKESLAMLNEEGLDQVFARHARLAAAAREGVRALGLPLFAASPSNGVTSVGPITEPNPDLLVKTLRANHGMRLAGGQGTMKGKIFRIGHMGAYNDQDVTDVLLALSSVLSELKVEGVR